MKNVLFVVSCAMLLAVGANAALISNGGFDEIGDWGWIANGEAQTTPGWTNVFDPALFTDANYGQDIFADGIDNRPALMKNTGAGNYLEQTLAGVDAGTNGTYTVGMDLGLRQHEYYTRDTHANPTQAGDILTLRVSLWDTTADVELDWTELTREFPALPFTNDVDNMTPESFDLTITGGVSGHGVAIRFTHMTPLDLAADEKLGYKQIMFDDVTVVPEPATMALLALGGLGLLKRRNR